MQGPQPKRKAIAGAGPVTFDRDAFGYPLNVDYGNFQVVCDGLDTGTYTVAARASGSSAFRTIQAGVAEGAFVKIDESFDIDAIRITYAALGGAAAPVARLSAIGRRYAWGG